MLNSVLNNEWIFLLTVLIILLGAAEAGFRLGLKLHQTKDEARRTQVGGVQGAVLGLLGLLLGLRLRWASTDITRTATWFSRRPMR